MMCEVEGRNRGSPLKQLALPPSARPDTASALPRSSRRCRDCPCSASLASTPLSRYYARPPSPSDGRFLSAPLFAPPSGLRRFALRSGFTPILEWSLRLRGLLALFPSEAHGRFALPLVWPFALSVAASMGRSPSLLPPLLTSRSALRRRPFRREARSPQVRGVAFPAQPPDLPRLPLVARASRLLARSPWSAPPPIRFLFVGSRFRSPLLSALPRGHSPCGSLGVAATSFPRGLSPPGHAHPGHTSQTAALASGRPVFDAIGCGDRI